MEFLARACLAALFCTSCVVVTATSPLPVLWYDLNTVVNNESLTYEEQMMVFVFQGLVNRPSGNPRLMLDGAYMNFDWPGADEFWRSYLESNDRVVFANVTSTFCGLLAEGDPGHIIQGAVAYDPTLDSGSSREWALPIAATVAAQQHLLPFTDAMLSRFPCLAALPIVVDLRIASWAGNQSASWDWAFENLLPNASKTVAFNLYHYMPQIMSDPQSNATLSSLDFAIQQNAFILNFVSSSNGQGSSLQPVFSVSTEGSSTVGSFRVYDVGVPTQS